MGQVAGKEFMFTGALSITRAKAQAMVEEAGGIAGASVNHGTDYLVVGESPGSKLGHAAALGIKTLTEKEFFDLLASGGKEILLSAEELEHLEDIPEKKWKHVHEVNPGLLLMSESQLERLIKKNRPDETVCSPIEEMTYYSEENLDKFLRDNPGFVFTKGPVQCSHCGHSVPYSISSDGIWYCFTCKAYFRPGEVGLHYCTDWKELDIEVGNGKYRKCELCGNVQFVTSEELVVNQEGHLRCNFVQSLEFLLPIRTALRQHMPDVVDVDYTENYEPDELARLREKFEKGITKRIDKRQEHFNAKREKRYKVPIDIQ